MKQPSLEEVKEYFKNAKTVECTNDLDVYVLDLSQNFQEPKDGKSIRILNQKDEPYSGTPSYCQLWSNQRGFAKILTYKEKTFSITESQINNLKKDIKNGYHVDAINYLKKLFPETFESKVKELKIGTWYNYNGSIVNYQGIESGILQAYGIRDLDKEWMNLSPMGSSPQKWVEATEQEVFEALKNEAVKRGYKLGVLIKNAYGEELISKDVYSSYDYKLHQKGYFLYEGFVLFESGKWAEIIPTITLSEAEQQLGKKIIV